MKLEKKLKIGEVSQLLNIPAYVLRYWENEFKTLRPAKSRSGQRLYSEKDVELIRKISKLRYEDKLTVSGCKSKLRTLKDSDEDTELSFNNNSLPINELKEIKKGLQEVLEDLR